MEKTSYERWIEDCINQGNKSINLTFKSLRDYQLNKIRETIDYVKKNSSFYRERLKNVNSYEIKDYNDFSQIVPFTYSQELSNKPLDFVCVPQHMISRIVTLKTSGTTGTSKRVFFTEEDLERTVDFFQNGMKYLISKGDRVLILMPGNYYGSIGDLLKRGLERLGCEGIALGPVDDGLKVLEGLKNESIDCIVGIPVQVYQLARYKMAYEKYKGIKLKSVLLSADYVPYSIKKVIEKAFSCSAFTHYGMTEMGFGGGVECKYLCGYHMREADLYFEIIDPVSQETLPWGDEGEIVFTTLTRKGMPLIRYRTGDLGSFMKERCKCSNVLPRMDYVRGRISEGIKLGDVNINIGALDEAMFTIENLLDYRAHLEEGNILQIWVKSIDPKNPVSLVDIEKAFYSSIIWGLLKEGKLNINYCGEIEDIQISTGMLKRKLV
jgi:phenylacetate-coenzyme A ligase PaaK-like adenylate-forming protein